MLAALIALHDPLDRTARAAAPAPLVVIVGRAIHLTDISSGQLRQVFLGARVDVRGLRLVPFNQAMETRERRLFDRALLGLEPDEVGPFWVRRRMRDEGLPPRVLPTAAIGPRVVAAFPGAITYVRADMADKTTRVLTIDGKSPSEPGYLLQD